MTRPRIQIEAHALMRVWKQGTSPKKLVRNFSVCKIVYFSIAGLDLKCPFSGKVVQMNAQWQ